MSTLLGNDHNTQIKSEDDLLHYFHGFAKKPADFRIGVEAEFLGVDRRSGQALPYDGPGGIQKILEALSRQFHYTPVLDEGNLIALTRDGLVIGLEPGGQLEISAPPVASIFEVARQLKLFLSELRQIENQFPEVKWLAYGIQPFSSLEEISWVPKRRYTVLADYLKTRGALSHHMMKRTATSQFNFDYKDETHAMAALRSSLAVTTIISAMFANASFSEGRLNGFASFRLEIWNQTAPDRSGILPQFLREKLCFKDYLEYMLTMPMIFIVRQSSWIPMQGMTFRDFIREGYHGFKATVSDFELLLSTAFPEVRIKQYLEVRGLDCQTPRLILAAAALWKGILYDDRALDEAWNLVSFAKAEDHLKLRSRIPYDGLQASLAGRPVLKLAEQLFEIAGNGLDRQGLDEQVFLKVVRDEILSKRKSPGEALIEKWNESFSQRPEALIKHLSLLP